MIYLASPYSHPDPLIMKTRFLMAEQATAFMLKVGKFVYSPIVHCHELAAKYSLPTDFDFWQRYNRDMIRRCSTFAILDIAGWRESKGVKGEFEFAALCGMLKILVDEEGKLKGGIKQWQE